MEKQTKKRKRQPRTGRHRAYIFVVNNYTEDHLQFYKNEVPTDPRVRYLIVGKEVCPKTKTPHLQGYIYYTDALSFDACIAFLTDDKRFPQPHIEASLGSALSNRKYSSKECVLIEHGTPPRPGKPTDSDENPTGLNAALAALQAKINDGASWEQLLEEDFALTCRYRGTPKEYCTVVSNRKQRKAPKVYILWGKTGCGKSHWIDACFGRGRQTYWVQSSRSRTWWNGYSQQRAVVFDDFEPRNMDQQAFKTLVDKFAARVEPKGDMINFTSEWIVFSSNEDPKTWYRNQGEYSDEADDVHYAACQRRIKDFATVMHFTTPYDSAFPNRGCGFLSVEAPWVQAAREADELQTVPSPRTGSPRHPVNVDDDDDDEPPAKQPAPHFRAIEDYLDNMADCSDDDDDEGDTEHDSDRAFIDNGTDTSCNCNDNACKHCNK